MNNCEKIANDICARLSTLNREILILNELLKPIDLLEIFKKQQKIEIQEKLQ